MAVNVMVPVVALAQSGLVDVVVNATAAGFERVTDSTVERQPLLSLAITE